MIIAIFTFLVTILRMIFFIFVGFRGVGENHSATNGGKITNFLILRYTLYEFSHGISVLGVFVRMLG